MTLCNTQNQRLEQINKIKMENSKPTYEDLKKKINDLESEIEQFKNNEFKIDKTKFEEAKMARDLFFESSIDMLCIIGFDSKFKKINPAWQKVLGWSKKELLGITYLELIHPDDLEKSLAVSKNAKPNGKPVNAFEN